ncbi:MAG: hypothetical protein RUMPE_00298 [Eubacteriales bacterium SKADARSKE-1]|nr:hypothetical protein [Eubacteriales bacterium SKADARSKE-1]
MSKENVAKFYELVNQDKGLQKNLQDIGEKYKDEKMDDSLKTFIVQTEIIPLARRSGFELKKEEVIDFLNERASKISKEAVRKISGGHSNEHHGHFSAGEMAAAKVAKKSIINSATDIANKFYQQNYKVDE